MNQTLNDKLETASELGFLKKEIPKNITGNLAPHICLRTYQTRVLERFLYFIDDFPHRPSNPHLLFQHGHRKRQDGANGGTDT